MTDEKRAEEYLKKNKICNNENWEVGGKYCYTLCKQAYLGGLAEERKENAELKEENKKLKEKLKKVQNYLAYEIPHDLMNEATKKIYKMV